MPIKISSAANPHVKRVTALRERRERDHAGLTLVEGDREIAAALTAKASIEAVFTCPSRHNERNSDLRRQLIALKKPVYELSEILFEKISYGDRRDDLIVIAKPLRYSFADFKESGRGFYVMVEEVEKPGNLGAILRSCEAAGADGVIICDGKTDLYNPNVIRSSVGTVFTVKTVVGSPMEAADFLTKRKIKICAASPSAEMVYWRADFKQAVSIIVGSEKDGLSDFWLRRADMKVKIPMRGKIDSLNVSASTAVLLYEVIRQRIHG